MKVLVIIPAYNEEKNIVDCVNNLMSVNNNIDYLVINDGSTDSTQSVCKENNFNCLNLVQNLGIGGCVQTGYKYAYRNGYDIAIQYDGDGQHDPKYISKLIEEISNGSDLVVGSRYIKDLSKFKSTFSRRIGIKFLSFLIKLCTGIKIYDPTSGFRACNRNVIYEFANDYPIDYPEPDSVTKIIKLGYNVNEIPVEMNERKNGKSSINFINSIYYMIKVSSCIIITTCTTKRRKK